VRQSTDLIRDRSLISEDDLAAGGLLVELADANDVRDLGTEGLHRQAEHVDAGATTRSPSISIAYSRRAA